MTTLAFTRALRRLFSGGKYRFILPLLYLLYCISLVSWQPFFSVYLRETGLSGLQVGTLQGVAQAVMFVSQPFWGLVADLRGRRKTLLVAMLLAALPLLGYAWPGGFWFFLGWIILQGFLSSGVGPLLDSMSLDYIDEGGGLTYGHLRLAGGLAWAIGASLVGRAIAGRDMRLMFVFAAGFMALAWFATWRGTQARPEAVAAGKSWRGAGALLRNREFVVFLVLALLLYVGAAPIWSFFPVYVSDMGAGSETIGLAFTLRGLGEMPLYLVSAAIIRRLSLRRTIVLTCFLFACRVLLYSIIRTPGVAIAVEVMHGVTFGLFSVSAVQYVRNLVAPEWRATGQTLFAAAFTGAGGILGNAWAGFLYDRLSAWGMFRVNGGLILLVGVLALVFLRPAGERETQGAGA